MRAIPHPTWIEIDLGQFRKNLDVLRGHLGVTRICLVLKANAYGHGLIPMAKAACGAGVDCLGVSCLQEGVHLRQAGIAAPILVLGAIHEDQIDEFVRYDLEFSISSKFKADLVARKGEGKFRVHLEVETGMQRTGVRCATAIELAKHLKALSCFEIAGVYSHLATADAPNHPFALEQISLFAELIRQDPFRGIPAHIANSGGIAHYPHSYFDMVRPGLIAYGYFPPHAPQTLRGIAPCFSLKSTVSYFKTVEAGKGIGYGRTYITPKQTRIVTVPIGYGDGYLRALSNRGSVLIRGKRFPIAGSICMDQCMVDIGDSEAYVGDEVVLIGKQGDLEISLDEVARLCGTVPYEILCLFNQRIPRLYLSDPG